jgi:20S proteasome subunit beta 4
MECLFGITGKDFVLVAADNVISRSIVVMKSGEDKTRNLTPHTCLLFSGEAGDTVQFAEYLQCNVQLYGITNDVEMTPSVVASFTRKELANSLRSRKPYHVNLLVAGFNNKTGPELYWLDHLASITRLPFASHGYASYFCMSLMDRHYHPNLSVEEAKELLRKCIHELKTRFIANLPKFVVKIIDKDGIREVEI